MNLRLVSYNIHKGIGGIDRLYRLERIIGVLAECKADIVYLQEVDDGVPRSRSDRQVDLLADALGFDYRAFQRNVKLKVGSYGNAIISRFPLHEVYDLDLTVRPKKRRRALMADCIIRGERQRTLHLVNCHLGLSGLERGIQMRRVLAIGQLKNLHRTTPLVVGGDLNDVWLTLGKRILEPAGFTAALKNTKTFPAAMPVRPLDNIYFRGELKLNHGFAKHNELARQASDHLPIVLDFELDL